MSKGTAIRNQIQRSLEEEQTIQKPAPEKVQLVAKSEPTPVPAPAAIGIGDLVCFKEEAGGPSGNLEVKKIEGDELFFLHEDGTMWRGKVTTVNLIRTKDHRNKITLSDQPTRVTEDSLQVTVESLTKMGFRTAPKEDFVGASDKTFFADVNSTNGFTTVVYDFQPPGNRGQPAVHAYYQSNDGAIFESLACFSAQATVGEIKKLIEAASKADPQESAENKRIESLTKLIERIVQ